MRLLSSVIVARSMALIAILFGALTIFSGGSVLFGPDAARESAGNVVPFVLWFNFMAGILYLIAGAALWLGNVRAVWLSACITLMTLAVFFALGIHIFADGLYENRTLAAMTLRFTFWMSFYLFARKHFACRTEPSI